METITDLGLFVFWLGTLLVWLAAWVHMSSLGNRIREVECDTDRLVSSQNTLRSSLKSDLVDVRNSADGRYETVTDYLQANKDRIEHLKQTIQAIYIRLDKLDKGRTDLRTKLHERVDKLDKMRVEDKENSRAAIELYRTNVNERIDKVGQQMINTNVHMDKVHNQQSSVIERVGNAESELDRLRDRIRPLEGNGLDEKAATATLKGLLDGSIDPNAGIAADMNADEVSP